jgi:hypothetical protein
MEAGWPGLPTAENTHEVVRKVPPGAPVVYADNDPMVLAYGRALLGDDRATAVVLADARPGRGPADHKPPKAVQTLAEVGLPPAAAISAPGTRSASFPAACSLPRPIRAPTRTSPGWGCGTARTRTWPIPRIPGGCTAEWAKKTA